MSNGNTTIVEGDPFDGRTVVINESGIAGEAIYNALHGPHPEIAQLMRWSITNSGEFGTGRGRVGNLFQRDRYVTPQRVFEQFKTARDIVDSDDVVSGVAESTESLAFNRISFACDDEDEEDIWSQIAFDIDVESRLREMWRELFSVSQFYAVTWWGQKDYKVRGKTVNGTRRKKVYPNLTVPLGVSILDPTKVVPVGNLMFNQEQLAYVADRTETDLLDAAVLNDPQADPVSRQIIVGKYDPPNYERTVLAGEGIEADWLYILNPRNVWRHTLTRSQYERFAKVRLKSIFELLDLKQQLRQMDRAYLIGGTNFIILIKKGTEHHPARPEEITQLQTQVTTVARIPIIVGDHRLSVEIITPKLDVTLSAEKYSTIDSRITTRLYQMFLVHSGAGTPRSDDSIKLAKVIARGLESRRYMLKRTLEREIMGPCVLANPSLTSQPTLRYHPTRVELDFDPSLVQYILDLRDRGDLSRDSVLNELDFDEDEEAIMRQREALYYDKYFTPTNVPFSAPGPGHLVPVGPGGKPSELPAEGAPSVGPAPTKPKQPSNPVPPAPNPKAVGRSAGRNLGGNRRGGGAAPGTGQGEPPRRGRPKNT